MFDADALASEVVARVRQTSTPSLVSVINASGVIIHTNLGRAPLSEATIAAMEAVSRGYTNLEFDLDGGGRGSRLDHLDRMIRTVVGCESGLAVNNNASALLLVLSTLADGREVIISRGQAVEIGGGFRIPDVMRQSGAILVEVGTTNRTRASDYANAVTERTAAIPQNGNPRKELEHAEQQVLDWLDWLDENPNYAQKSLPGVVRPTGFVIIGTNRDLSIDDIHRLRRRNLAFQGSIQIMTFDDFLDRAKNLKKVLTEYNKGLTSLSS